MASTNEINALKVAIDICNKDTFKNTVIKVSKNWLHGSTDPKAFKKEWNRRLEQYLLIFFEEGSEDVDRETRDTVTGIVLSIALRMLTWTEYHMRTFDFKQDFCLSLLTSDALTEEGLVDYRRTEEELENGRLSIEQRFQLASWHCKQDISEDLFNQLQKEKKKFYIENENEYIPEIIQFWAYNKSKQIPALMRKLSSEAATHVGHPGEDDSKVLNQFSRLLNEENIKCVTDEEDGAVLIIKQFMLQNAILSGSKTAVKHCIGKILEDKVKNKDLLPDALIQLVIKRMELSSYLMEELKTKFKESRKYVDDWFVFRYPKGTKEEVWLPNHFTVDIFYYIFSLMSSEETKRIAPKLKNAIEFNLKFRKSHYKQLFCHFLCWPYQDRLMNFVNLCWEYIPFDYYGTFLFTILDRIEPSSDSLYYGENMCFNYKSLFLQFWNESPENFKRYVFRDMTGIEEGFYLQGKTTKVLNVGKTLLRFLINEKFFLELNYKLILIIKQILDDAEPSERENFILSKEGKYVCYHLREKSDPFFGELIKLCLESKQQIEDFKNQFNTCKTCLDLIEKLDFDEAEKYILSLGLPSQEYYDLKEIIIFSKRGKELLRNFGFEKMKNFLDFVTWSRIPKGNFLSLHIRLLDAGGQLACLRRFLDNSESVNRLLVLCFTSLSNILNLYDPSATLPENIYNEMITFKQEILYSHATYLCDIIMFEKKYARYEMQERLTLIEKFLDWCLNGISEDEKSRKCEEFKTDLLRLKNEFCYKFIKSSRFDDATFFLTWAGLDAEAIKKEKSTQLFDCFLTRKLFLTALKEKNISENREKQEIFIKDLLKWCLVDSDTSNKFHEYYVDSFDSFLFDIITEINDKFLRIN